MGWLLKQGGTQRGCSVFSPAVWLNSLSWKMLSLDRRLRGSTRNISNLPASFHLDLGRNDSQGSQARGGGVGSKPSRVGKELSLSPHALEMAAQWT